MIPLADTLTYMQRLNLWNDRIFPAMLSASFFSSKFPNPFTVILAAIIISNSMYYLYYGAALEIIYRLHHLYTQSLCSSAQKYFPEVTN